MIQFLSNNLDISPSAAFCLYQILNKEVRYSGFTWESNRKGRSIGELQTYGKPQERSIGELQTYGKPQEQDYKEKCLGYA